MEQTTVLSVSTTTNIYVKKAIVRNNITILNNRIYLSSQHQDTWLVKRDLQMQLDAQIILLSRINKEIKKKEQFSIIFFQSIVQPNN